MRGLAAVLTLFWLAWALPAAGVEPARDKAAATAAAIAAAMDPAQPPQARLDSARALQTANALTPETALWLLTDFLALPDLPLELRVQSAEIAFQIAQAKLVPFLAGVSADPGQRKTAAAVSAAMTPGLLKLVFNVLFNPNNPAERRAEAATVILNLEFSDAAWAGLRVTPANRRWQDYAMGAAALAGDPDARIRAALARCIAKTEGVWGGAAVVKLRKDDDPLVQAEMLSVPASPPPTDNAREARHVTHSAGVMRQSPGGAPKPAAAQEPSPSHPSAPPPPSGGKKKEIVVTEARLELLRDLSEQEWFRFPYAASAAFRAGFEKLLSEAAEKGQRAQIYEGALPRGVQLTIRAPDGAAVFLNDVYAGRAPLPPLRVPSDTYRLRLELAGTVASRLEDLKDGQREFEFLAADFSPAATAPPPLTAEASEFGIPSWTLALAGRRVDRLVATEDGVVLAGDQDGPRLWFHDRRAGHPRWEAALGLPPTGEPTRFGGRLYWGAIDGFLHAVDIATGSTARVAPLGGPLEIAPQPFGEYLACAARDTAEGGQVTVVDVGAGQVRWARRTAGRPVALIPLEGGIAVVTEAAGGAGRIALLEAGDGRERWSKPIARREGMVVAGAGAHLLLRDGDSTRPPAFLGLESGEPRVLVELEGGDEVVGGFVRANRAALVTAKAQLYWVDPARRRILWHRPLPAWDGRAVRLFDAGAERIHLIAGNARQTDDGEMRTGVFQAINASTGGILFSTALSLSAPPADLGQGRVLVVDPNGSLLVRDFRRAWTPIAVEAGLAVGVGGLPSSAAAGAVYVASRSRKELIAFDLGRPRPLAPPARTTGPDTPVPGPP